MYAEDQRLVLDSSSAQLTCTTCARVVEHHLTYEDVYRHGSHQHGTPQPAPISAADFSPVLGKRKRAETPPPEESRLVKIINEMISVARYPECISRDAVEIASTMTHTKHNAAASIYIALKRHGYGRSEKEISHDLDLPAHLVGKAIKHFLSGENCRPGDRVPIAPGDLVARVVQAIPGMFGHAKRGRVIAQCRRANVGELAEGRSPLTVAAAIAFDTLAKELRIDEIGNLLSMSEGANEKKIRGKLLHAVADGAGVGTVAMKQVMKLLKI